MSTPPIDAETFAAQREQALARFGSMLLNWRVRNGWTQHTAHQWATAAGFRALTAGNLSKLERGLAGSPSPSTIFQLADLNHRLASRDWGTVRDRKLRDRLEDAQPICDEEGKPWGPTEFWAASVGLEPIPPDLLAPAIEPTPELTDSDAAALSQQWRQWFSAAVLTHDLDPLEEVATVARLVALEHRRKLRKVLTLGGCSFTADELREQWANGWQPEQAVRQWLQELETAPSSQEHRDS